MLNTTVNLLKELNANEYGEMPIGPILLIALIVIPLVFFLITFRDNLLQFFTEMIGNMFGQAKGGNMPDAPTF